MTDEKILEEIETIYEEEKELVKIFLLNNNEFNDLKPSYFLILKKNIIQGIHSIYDYNSEEFFQYISKPENLKIFGIRESIKLREIYLIKNIQNKFLEINLQFFRKLIEIFFFKKKFICICK